MKKIRYLYYFLLGALCFYISQPLTRLPLMNYLSTNPSIVNFLTRFPIATYILWTYSAGLFEEFSRFFFRRFIKPRGNILEPIIFGLGHGLCEVVQLYFILGFLPNIQIFIERPIAIVFHICQTIFVWRGFKAGKPLLYTWIAVFLHGTFNLIAVVVMKSFGVLWSELILGLASLVYILYSVRNRKDFGGNYEKEN